MTRIGIDAVAPLNAGRTSWLLDLALRSALGFSCMPLPDAAPSGEPGTYPRRGRHTINQIIRRTEDHGVHDRRASRHLGRGPGGSPNPDRSPDTKLADARLASACRCVEIDSTDRRQSAASAGSRTRQWFEHGSAGTPVREPERRYESRFGGGEPSLRGEHAQTAEAPQSSRSGVDRRLPVVRTRIGHWRGYCYEMSEAGIASAMAGERAELALIDGPKSAWTMRGDCRYATLPLIRRWLVDGALVIVDDAHRRRERDIIERWTAERLFEPLRSYAVGGGLNVGRVSASRV